MSYSDEESFSVLVSKLQSELIRVANELRSGSCGENELERLLDKVEENAISEEEIVIYEKLREAVRMTKSVEEEGREGVVDESVVEEVEEGSVEEDCAPVWQIEYTPINEECIENQRNEAIQRGVEIDKIVNSVVELNEVFRDLDNLVIEQGEIVEHISNNIDYAVENTRGASRNLYQADKWDRRRNKCRFILIVIVVIIIMIFIALIV